MKSGVTDRAVMPLFPLQIVANIACVAVAVGFVGIELLRRYRN